MQIETDSIRLRPLQEDDADPIADACAADPDIAEWVMRLDAASKSAAAIWIGERQVAEQRGEQVVRAVVDPVADRFLGAIWLGRFDREAKRAELAYWTVPAERGRGVATAAVRLMSSFGFQELNLLRVQILAAVENPASERVAVKAGYTREGVLRSYRRIAGKHTDLVMYSLLRQEPT